MLFIVSFIGSQYSDYMVLDYSCLQGPSLSVCEFNSISSSWIDNQEHRLFLRSSNYPNEYDNSLNCSCQIRTDRAQVKFLDFYLEERDEMNQCSRDRLQIANHSYCGSTLDDHKSISSIIVLNSSTQLMFKTNDVITRKGFWLMMNSQQPIHVSCSNSIDLTTTVTSSTSSSMTIMKTITTATATTTTTPELVYSILSSAPSSIVSSNELSRSNDNQTRRHTLSYILLLTIVFVVVLLLLNLILVIVCWKQKRSKKTIDSKKNNSNRPFFCSLRSASSSSSSSSMTYGETPVLNSLDTQKASSTSARYILQPNLQQLDTTPSTSTTTGPYEDLHDSLTQQKSLNEHFLYIQQRHIPTASSPYAGYNRMVHFPPAPIRCHASIPAQTFYPPQPFFDCQHIYETIQDGQCPYQRLAATLRRPSANVALPSQSTCTCHYECNESTHPNRIQRTENSLSEINPETLV
jgi:hypothetical protein